MIIKFLGWLGKNLSTLFIAFLLALVVWVSAVIATDPNQEQPLPYSTPLEVMSLDPGLLLLGDFPGQVNVTLNAPRSVWAQLSGDQKSVKAWIDLSTLGPGEHVVPVHVVVARNPVRIVQIEPAEIRLTLETLISLPYSVTLVVEGNPALGYEAGTPTTQPAQVTVTGAESRVVLVKEIRTDLNISEADQTITAAIPLKAYDASGKVVNNITISPESVSVKQPINLLGGYRNVIVKVITTGQVANGYKLTTITPTPPNMIVFSSDPQLLNELPGYVETQPLDLTGLQDDVEMLLELVMPAGISAVSDKKVLVQVGVAAIESSLTLSLPVEVIGLTPGLEVIIAPTLVDVLLSGPVPVLNTLKPSDLRLVVDLTGMEPGVYIITPTVDFLPQRIQVISILPSEIDVTISFAPTPTPTPTPTITPTPTVTPRP